MARLSIQQRVGKNIRHYRKEKGLSQEKLANITGIARSYIGGIERGERNPSVRSVQKIAKAVGVAPADLFGT